VNQRLLRDWLCAHPEDATRYAHAKCDAVAAAARGTASYNDAKTPIVQELVDHARAARGLSSVPASAIPARDVHNPLARAHWP
jgi:hypothetical protein